MEPQPVKENKTPSYPTRRDVLAGAAGFVAAGLCGRLCLFAETEEGKTVVAPIFEHGEGRGATGCIVVSPPVFLSEEEAMQIIREELGKHGITLGPGNILKGVQILHRQRDGTNKDGQAVLVEIDPNKSPLKPDIKPSQMTEEQKKMVEEHKKTFAAKPLRLSGLDAKKKIAVKLVTVRNCDNLGGASCLGTLNLYNLREVAEYVAGKAKKQCKEPVYLGIFYDPLVELDFESSYVKSKTEKIDLEAALDKIVAKGKQDARKLLRLQAEDFAAWLKEKKVIEK